MSSRRLTISLAFSALVACVSVAGLLSQSLKPAAADPAPQSPKDLFQEKCSACHDAPNPNEDVKTAVQWSRTVDAMLYQRGASSSISTAQAQTIKTYLATFAIPDAPRLFGRGGQNPANADVWPGDPFYSRVYRFRTSAVAAPLKPVSGHYAVRDGGSGPQLMLSALPKSPTPALLLAPTPAGAAGIQVEAEFRASAPPDSAVIPPVSFGLVFDATDGSNYDLASYDDSTRLLKITRIGAGTATDAASVTLPAPLTPTPDGWHKLRVMVTSSRVKVWLDYDKLIEQPLSIGSIRGSVGVWSGRRAAARSLTVDLYGNDGLAGAPLT